MNDTNPNKILKAGVMGWPIGHSLSPRLHGYWLKKYNINGTYAALAVTPEKLEEALKDLSSQGFRGVNLTLPHKEAALQIVHVIDPVALKIGAVNTVVVMEDGRLEGRNTDMFGFSQNLLAHGVRLNQKAAIVLGAGGAARAVVVALMELGVSAIRLVNRTKERAEELRRALNGHIEILSWEQGQSALKDCGFLVNTTSLGMQGQPPLEFNLDALPLDSAVADLVYAPRMTPLLLRAHKRGHTTIDGLGMLLHQARPAFRAFFGIDPEVTDHLRTFVLEGK